MEDLLVNLLIMKVIFKGGNLMVTHFTVVFHDSLDFDFKEYHVFYSLFTFEFKLTYYYLLWSLE